MTSLATPHADGPMEFALRYAGCGLRVVPIERDYNGVHPAQRQLPGCVLRTFSRKAPR